MKPIFWLAGGVLGVAGILQLAELALSGNFSAGPLRWLLLGLVAAAYLITAYFLLRRSDTAVTFGIIVPAARVIADLMGILPEAALFGTALLLADVVAVAASVYLFMTGRAPIGRVR